MRSRLLILLLGLAGGLVTSAWAADALTLQACLAEAAENNPGLVAAKESLQKATYDYKGSYSTFLPQLSANAGHSRNGNESSATGSTGSTISDNNSMGVSVSQTLFAGGRNRAAMDQAAANKQIAEDQLLIAKAQLTFDVRQAFVDLLFAQANVALTEAIAKRRADNASLIQLRYESGKEHKGSLLYIQASYGEAQFEVAQAERALRVAERGLARVLGRSETASLAVKGEWTTDQPGHGYDFAALADETPQHRLSLGQVRIAQAGVASAQSEFSPQVAANASAGRSSEDWPPRDDEWSVGVSLTFPFFPGGKNFMDVKSAKAEHRRAKASALNSDEQLVLDLESAFAQYQDAVELREVQAQFLTAAEVRAEIAQAQYTSGLLSFQDWDTIENALISQQKSTLASRRDAVIGEANWEKTRGANRLP